MTVTRTLHTAAKVLGLIMTLTCILLVASQALGGPVAIVTTRGSSMAPHYQEGDLVLVRRGSYAPGDVVAYRSASLRAVVLHRIVRTEGDRFVFKGDANAWLDAERPSRSEVVGKHLLRIPAAGKAMEMLRTPRGIAVSVAGAVLLAAVRAARRRRRRGQRHTGQLPAAPPRPTDHAATGGRAAQIAIAGGAVFFVALTAGAGLIPTSQDPTAPVSFKHAGTFGYSARVPAGPVYEQRHIKTGDTVYLKLAPAIDVTFNYRFRSDAEHAVQTRGRLVAMVSGDTGWNRTIEIQGSKTFHGDDALLRGRLDLSKIWRGIDEFQRLAGIQNGTYTLAIVPRLHVSGTVAGTAVDEEFSPTLPLQFDRTLVRPAPRAAADATTTDEPPPDPLEPTQLGSVGRSGAVHRVISIGRIRLDGGVARGIGITGALACLLAYATLIWRRSKDEDEGDEAARIAHRHREWITPVLNRISLSSNDVIDVASIESLLRLAERCDRMILHDGKDRSVFVVVDNETAYRYTAGAAITSIAGRGQSPEGVSQQKAAGMMGGGDA